MRLIQKTWLLQFLTLLAATLFIAGCVRVQKLKPGSEQTGFFRPPTLVPTSLPPTPTLAVPSGTTQDIQCVNSLSFVSDVTIPDGTTVTAGSSMDKRWEIKNTGTCNWGEGYTLRLISGSEMGVEKEQSLIPARSGNQTVVRIVFTAPSETGLHRSAWQAYDPEGQPFGDLFFIEIEVETTSPTSTPTP